MDFYTDNYERANISRPNDKFKMGENGGKGRFLIGDAVVSDALAIGDRILVGKIPANSRIVRAQAIVDKSLGATGILTLGHGATEDEEGNAIASDDDGVLGAIDAGGQAAYVVNDAANTIIQKRLAKETLIYAIATEAVDGNVDDAVASFFVEYVND